MSVLSKSPWARSWMHDQKDERPHQLKMDATERSLAVILIVGICLMVGLQVGMAIGRDDGIKAGQAELWAKHYASYSKVQWLVDEADLKRMYEQR